MQNVNALHVLTVMLLVATVSAKAAPTTALDEIPVPRLDLERLELIQGDTMLFEAQAARAKALLALQQNNGYDTSLPSPLTQTLLAPAPGGTTAQDSPLPARTSLPRIIEISGSGKALRTRLALSDGATVEVTAGQRVPGSSDSIKMISPQEVQLMTATGETHTLAFTE